MILYRDGLRVCLDHTGVANGPDYTNKINRGKVNVVLPEDLGKWANQFGSPRQEAQVALFIDDESDDEVAMALGIAAVPSVATTFEQAQSQPGGVLLLTLKHEEVEQLYAVLALIMASNKGYVGPNR